MSESLRVDHVVGRGTGDRIPIRFTTGAPGVRGVTIATQEGGVTL
jgi:hypothetical protein